MFFFQVYVLDTDSNAAYFVLSLSQQISACSCTTSLSESQTCTDKTLVSKLVVLASLDLAMCSFLQEILWNRQNYELFPIPIILLLCIPLLFPGRFRNRVSDLQTVIPLKCYCIILNGITYPVPSSSLQKVI